MKKIKLFCLTALNVFYSYAQNPKMKQGDKKYDGYAYVDAIKTYERIASKGYKSEDLFRRLGNSYYYNSDFVKAAVWYGELFELNSSPQAEYYHRYAQSLRSSGQAEKAAAVSNAFSLKFKNDTRAELYSKNADYLDEIKANSGRYKIEDAGINSKYSDYGSFVHDSKIYFTSARDTGNFSQRRHSWTGKYFTNIYSAGLDSQSGAPEKAEKLKSGINTRFNESSIVFASDGKTAYFTRNSFLRGKKGKDAGNNMLIKIYKAVLENGKWTKATALPFTSDSYSTAHPCLSPDGKTLYFASDMPGTMGQSDIYRVSVNSDGSFGIPENLGKSINTEGRETFPYVTEENEIYFASDGHPGLGGLDVFAGNIEADGTISGIQNLGNDINSGHDDFAYTIDPLTRQGYFSSNREGGKGSDDIYKFTETRPLKCYEILAGVVIDSQSNAVLAGVKATLYADQKVKSSTVTDSQGRYSFEMECGRNYIIRVEKPDYETKEVSIRIDNKTDCKSLPIAMEKSVCRVYVGDDLGKCFGIQMIYFDFNKSDIRSEAVLDLEKILDVLKQNPSMKLDIRSHTDSRASKKYNSNLSERRAQETVNWLVRNGVEKGRLTGRGYGESQLQNKCSDGVDCNEEEHQANRRSEFIITEL